MRGVGLDRRGGRLAQALDRQSGGLERPRVGLERVGAAGEAHAEAVALHGDGELARGEVGAVDDERRVGRGARPAAGVGERVRDRDAEAPARRQHARGLRDRGRHVVDVHEDVVGDDEVEGAVGEGQPVGGGHAVPPSGCAAAAAASSVGDASTAVTRGRAPRGPG